MTTSQKLSTGVDARNVRSIVLMRPVNQIIEFKQIIGRGTRTFDGKDYFTIYDFVDAHHRFLDPEWDGEPEEPVVNPPPDTTVPTDDMEKPDQEGKDKKTKIKIKLREGKELEIQHTMQTMFWNSSGQPITAEEFLHNLFGEIPNLFSSETELRKLWSKPATRKKLLEELAAAGYGLEELNALKKLIDAENNDLFDVLEYVFNSDVKPITRAERVAETKSTILTFLTANQREFIEFVLDKYIEVGVSELEQAKLPLLLESMYQSQTDGINHLGGDLQSISKLFVDFQQHLYEVA